MVHTGSDPPAPKRMPRHFRNDDIPTDTFTPRAYQVELLDSALHKNTIVCLGSTAGNTFLSVMLIREMSNQLRPSIEAGGKRSFVLVNNDYGIFNLSQVIQHHTDLTVSKFHNDQGDHYDWSSTQWSKHINSHHIMIIPPDLFLRLLSQHTIHPSHINLVIFDDCHLILQDHSYVEIMKKLRTSYDKNSIDFPRILGLTSCFTSKKCSDPEELGHSINSLETLLISKAETATLVIAERYGIRPKEHIIQCENYNDSTGTVALLETILCSSLDFLHECNIVDEEEEESRDPCSIPITALSECLNILYILGPWCASCIAGMLVNQIDKIDKHETSALHKKFLHYAATQLRFITMVFEANFSPEYDVEELLMYSSPKVCELISHLRKYRPECDFMIVSSADGEMDGMMGLSGDSDSDLSDDSDFSDDDGNSRSQMDNHNVIHVAVKKTPDLENTLNSKDPLSNDTEKYLCGIVFVDDRNVALVLNKFLEEVFAWDETLCFVKSHHITGQNSRMSAGKKGGCKLYKKQEDCLRKFRMQDLNLLISTSVLEEGIDVPKCNLIVKFDPPKDYKSYSQSKGRARARDAEYIVLVDENKMEAFQKEYNVYKNIEKVLVGRHEKSAQDEDSDVMNFIQPYIPNSNQPHICVTLDSAIALINRYCAKLPSDAFTHLTPKCKVETVQNNHGITLYRGSLRLPINSPYKELIQGSTMPTEQLAKKEVALRMCKALHQSGELDDSLMPIGKEIFNAEDDDVAEWESEDMYGEARPGTTKRKQYYFKRLASALVNSHPGLEDNYLYNLKMVLTKPISDEQNTRGRRIYAPEESPKGFGILTSKEIPQIPEFPVYTRSGEVMVSVELIEKNVSVTMEEQKRLTFSHHFLFANVLRLEKDPMEFNFLQSEIGYMVVPLLRDSERKKHFIDWSFISKLEQSKSHVKRNIFDSKREPFVFKQEDYNDAVVMPSYRNTDQPQHFYVAEIRQDLNPLSPFPSPELYKTFSEYYTTKYGLTITNFDQPLLDVDHTSARLNLLTPRYMNQKGVALPTSSAETKKARRENLQQKQILVAELCEIHVYPATLWKKAVCLPTILYRINYLLVAEEIRIKISSETGIGLKNLPDGFQFPALDFGFKLKTSKEDSNGVQEVEECFVCSPESVQENKKSPNSVNGSSPNAQYSQELNHVQDEHSDASDKMSASPVDCDSVPTRRRSSLAVISLFSKEGLQDYLETSKTLCDTSNCDNEKASDQENHEYSKASDIVIGSNQSHGKTSDQELSKDQEDMQASDVIWSEKNNAKASEENHGTFQNNYSKENKNCYSELSDDDLKASDFDITISNGAPSIFKALDKALDNEEKDSRISSEKSYPAFQSESDKSVSGGIICDNSKPNLGSFKGSINDDKMKKESDPLVPPREEVDGTQVLANGLTGLSLGSADSSNVNSRKAIAKVHIYDRGLEKEGDIFSHMTRFMPDDKKGYEQPQKVETELDSHSHCPNLYLDEDIDLGKYIGPNPCTVLQALTMSNANDFFSLERLETIGDSFLKYAITVHLYCTYPGIHEGKLSYLRSKQVSNCNLYRLGKRKGFAECMISTKFEPYENWLPPGYVINDSKRKGSVPKVLLVRNNYGHLEKVNDQTLLDSYSTEDTSLTWTPNITEVKEVEQQPIRNRSRNIQSIHQKQEFDKELLELSSLQQHVQQEESKMQGQYLIPYSLQTLHSIPDKSIADCVESLIGCYLTFCGKKAALQFMHWLGLKVLPPRRIVSSGDDSGLMEDLEKLKCPSSPLQENGPEIKSELEHLLIGYDQLEESIGYKFKDRSYLLQAFTHASYHYNNVTDCYQRLEFLGDAILDYVITRHLYEDSCKYSPGVLTDLRSALVNNNIFAALAVKWEFHKYFKAISPPLFHVIEKFVARQKERDDEIDLSDEEENVEEEAERVELEVPKALGDIFESLAGAIYLDSGMSLDEVWRVYYRVMKPQIDKYLKSIPKSPVRELLEMEPETAKFEKPERTLEGKIRVKVNVVSKGVFTGIGRNYRIAKSAAAKKALRSIKAMQTDGLI